MAGFDDLIPAAMPYLATEKITAVAGTSWQWDYDLLDDAGNPVDISTGYTSAAVIRSRNADGTYTTVYTPTCTTPSTGVLRCTVSPATTSSDTGKTYYHEVTVTRTSDSAKVCVVGGGDATFVVKRKVS